MVQDIATALSSPLNQSRCTMPFHTDARRFKHVVVLLCMSWLSHIVLGQNNWLHPDEHIRAPHYLSWIDALEGTELWRESQLLTTLPNGRTVSMNAHAQDGRALIHIDSDMRWVVGSDKPLFNLSSSLVQGYNGGSLDFMWRNHLHSLGGYGLWRRHFDLIRFHGGGQGWQKVATQGQKPEDRSDSDRTLSYFANGKAHLFVDPSSSSDFQTDANFVYHVLDLDNRQWVRKGGVDARLGMLRGGVGLPVGWLLFNATGELIWVDFEQESARLLPNRAGILEAFFAWHREEGRMTFVGDSSIWHEWNGERLALEIPWREFEAAPVVPLFVPSPLPSGQPSTSDASSALGEAPEVRFNLLQMLPWLLIVSLATWFWLDRRKSDRQGGVHALANPTEAQREGQSQGQFSALTQMVLQHMGKQFETEELDVMLGINHLSSPETLRSQRARMIQRVNTEYRVTQGQDLIVRQRAFSDRRRSVYVIGGSPVDEAAADGEPTV